MTWTAKSGNTYKLCLLDTNVLSEIVKRPNIEGKGFIERFGPSAFAPCFSVYNLIELRRKQELFQAFVEFFANYPCFLLKPHQLILNEEKNLHKDLSILSPLMHAFSNAGPNSSYDFSNFANRLFSYGDIAEIERNWRNEESETLQVWTSRVSNFNQKRLVPNAKDADEYVKEAGLQSLIASDPEWSQAELNQGRIPDIDSFPSLKTILYSQYYRLYDPNWVPKPQDVTDILIMSAAPYVDVVITEAFQAEILKKIRKKVKGLEKVEIVRLKGIRPKIK